MQEKIIPTKIQRLFWDIDVSKLDTSAHKKTIIERVLNKGNLSDWRWLVSIYGIQDIKGMLIKKSVLNRDNIRPQSKYLANLLVK